MAFKIRVAIFARQDIVETADFIREKAGPERARRWKNGLLRAIGSLDKMPYRCPLADESEDVGQELRELHYYSHRVIFYLDDGTKTVHILRVYHAARSPLHTDDLM